MTAWVAAKGEVFITRTSDWKLIRRHKFKSSTKRIFFSPEGDLYAVSGRDQNCKVFRTSDGEVVADLIHRGNLKMLPGDDYGDENPVIEALQWTADGQHLLTGGVIDGIMRVWRRDDWSLIGYVQAQETNRQIEYIDVSSDNEVIVGVDGKASSSSDKITFPPSTSAYAWSKATKDNNDASISIASTGLHTVNVWMDEDGTKLDRILLTSDAQYDPSSVNGGEGPESSSR